MKKRRRKRVESGGEERTIGDEGEEDRTKANERGIREEEVTKRTYRQRTDSAGRGEEGEGARRCGGE